MRGMRILLRPTSVAEQRARYRRAVETMFMYRRAVFSSVLMILLVAVSCQEPSAGKTFTLQEGSPHRGPAIRSCYISIALEWCGLIRLHTEECMACMTVKRHNTEPFSESVVLKRWVF